MASYTGPVPRTVAVIGTGLIGASVGLAAKAAGVASVTGFDTDREALAVAAARGAVDIAAESLERAVADADLVVVATPLAAIATSVADALASTGPTCTVTDVGSTKTGICSALAGESRFVGGHPLSGSEAHGPSSARVGLFERGTWFLTPVAETDPGRLREAQMFVSSLGAEAVMIDPVAHDELVALTSHLPHALANLLVNHAGAEQVAGHDPLAAAGGSLRDMTRVAGANPRIWVDIFVDNAEPLRRVLAEHRKRVEELEEALRARDVEALARSVEEAARNRERLRADGAEA